MVSGQPGRWKPWSCWNCNKSYKNKGTLSRHLRYECGKEPKFECAMCEKKFKHKQNLKVHLLTMHDIRSEESLHIKGPDTYNDWKWTSSCTHAVYNIMSTVCILTIKDFVHNITCHPLVLSITFYCPETFVALAKI